MNGQLPIRQRIRKALILLSLLIFPITMNYFSPYVIIDGAAQGIISGSFIFFGLLFLSALFFGRLWCGWACPAAGLNEAAAVVNNRPVSAFSAAFAWMAVPRARSGIHFRRVRKFDLR